MTTAVAPARPYDLLPSVAADGERVVELKFDGVPVAFAVETAGGFWVVMVSTDVVPADVDIADGGFAVVDRDAAVAALRAMAGLYLSGFRAVAL